MKKMYALVFVLFLMKSISAQTGQPCAPCLPGGINFNAQAQIDAFQTNFPGCDQIQGNVSIGGPDIVNLNGLSVLTSIMGDLTIWYNMALTDLTGLDNVTSIGGNVEFSWNSVLVDFTGLNNLASIGGDLRIDWNFALSDMDGLNTLDSIGGSFFIWKNDVLSSLAGLENLTSVGGGFEIGVYDWGTQECLGNTALINLAGLDGLTVIGDNLSIKCNTSLKSLTGLQNITSIGSFLSIQRNDSLSDLYELNNLTSIGSYLLINNNVRLVSLTGLDNFDGSTLWDLQISGNGSLSNCAVKSICEYLADPVNTALIQGNATGCSSRLEVEDSCAALAVGSLIPHSLLTIYPNPSSTCIAIETSAAGELSILNLNGQPLITHQVMEAKTQVDISTLPGGVYLVKFVGENGVQAGKFIKK